jgi:hypothetical protein
MNTLLLRSFTAALVAVSSLSLYASPSIAEERNSQHGELQLEVAQKKGDPFSAVKEQAHSFISAISQQVQTLAIGNSATLPPPPSDQVLRYIAAAYLHCSVQRGTCPEILDAVLEYDIIVSRFNKTPACPTMLRLWDSWIKNDMEKRHQYLTKTGFFTATNEFRQRVRPRYTKCVATVTESIQGDPNHAVFFSKRYAPKEPVRAQITNAVVIMDSIKAKVENIFTLIGLK